MCDLQIPSNRLTWGRLTNLILWSTGTGPNEGEPVSVIINEIPTKIQLIRYDDFSLMHDDVNDRLYIAFGSLEENDFVDVTNFNDENVMHLIRQNTHEFFPS